MSIDKQKSAPTHDNADDPAADLVRAKLKSLYGEEPNALEEKAEVDHLKKAEMSKHQRYMKSLTESGKSMEEIQVAWHSYYANLPDTEKHEVWQEFYSEHERAKQASQTKVETTPQEVTKVTETPSDAHRSRTIPVSNNTATMKRRRKRPDTRTALDVKSQLISNIKERGDNHHVRSLVFGLSVGLVTIFIMMFGFFNERFIAPFIRPSGDVSATPIIVDPNASGPVGKDPKIIIPKINVEAPVVYDVPTIQEEDVQKGLERGVVHYINTPQPGEKGNSVIFGHSSSNILNKGKYKFAFILLKSLENGDTFIVEKDGKRYVYKVYNKFVTDPKDFTVIGQTDKTASMTLITCDPPGTSTNRLIIQAEQIYPNPSTNAESTATGSVQQATQLPSNSPTLWSRILDWF
jgi:sortase A